MKIQHLSKTDGDLFGGANVALTLTYADTAAATSTIGKRSAERPAAVTTAPTDATGQAKTTLTLGPLAGTNTVTRSFFFDSFVTIDQIGNGTAKGLVVNLVGYQ